MAGLNILFSNDAAKQWADRFAVSIPATISRALESGVNEAATVIEAKSRDNIAGSGRFGKRFVYGLFTDVTKRSQFNFTIDVAHRIWFAPIHEFGGTIRGKPMLWIPLSFAADAQGVWARDYSRYEGGLFRVDRVGKAPLLLSIRDKQPKYFGIRQVTLRSRWNIRGITGNIMRNFQYYYDKNIGR